MTVSSLLTSFRPGIIIVYLLILTGCAQESEDDSLDGSAVYEPLGIEVTSSAQKAALPVIKSNLWNEKSVRKILHTFAYGGLATDEQVSLWANMRPNVAITEMLTFTYVNDKLSPVGDQSADFATSMQDLQSFWSSSDDSQLALATPGYDNPMLWSRRAAYATLSKRSLLSMSNLQRTWIQAVNTRGINPFLHKIALFLTSHHMAVTILKGKIGLTRDYYDQTVSDLVAGKNFVEIIAGASKSAAVAKRYDHRSNTFDNDLGRFSGNDDFAREFFQLFFRHQGQSEEQDYHENVTIDNMALLLTGMKIDKVIFNHGSVARDHWWASPLDFTDHYDGTFEFIGNITNHHAGCLEILHEQICGINAGEKIDALSVIVARQQEVLDNLPVFIISSLADDQLSNADKGLIRKAWLLANDNLLEFIRAYAISQQFHSASRIKYMASLDRNLALYNAVVVDNEESFLGRITGDSGLQIMSDQGGNVFQPNHDVFGAQTGIEASKNSYIFKRAFEYATQSFGSGLTRYTRSYYADESSSTLTEWSKDWSRIIPAGAGGLYKIADVTEWLWKRIIVDGGANLDNIARAQIYSLIAYGNDFGYQTTIEYPSKYSDPNAVITSAMLNDNSDFLAMLNTMSNSLIMLQSGNGNTRKEANRRINLAVGFISMMPYTFVETGQ